jgi:3D (Asp-Asp-Asp) domain-containing protein
MLNQKLIITLLASMLLLSSCKNQLPNQKNPPFQVNETLEKDIPKQVVSEKNQPAGASSSKKNVSYSKGKLSTDKPANSSLNTLEQNPIPTKGTEGKLVKEKPKESVIEKKIEHSQIAPKIPAKEDRKIEVRVQPKETEQAQEVNSYPLTIFSTYYYVIDEEDFEGEARTSAVKSMDGEVLALVSPRFKKALLMEGTGVLLDKRILNYVGSKLGTSRFTVIKEPFGRGSTGCSLIPFKSIAVDPKVIPLGSIVKIQETVGMILPDGTRHNGQWFADDIGQIISGRRIDLFIGREKNVSTLKKQGIAENNSRLHYTFLKSDMSRSRCKEKKY